MNVIVPKVKASTIAKILVEGLLSLLVKHKVNVVGREVVRRSSHDRVSVKGRLVTQASFLHWSYRSTGTLIIFFWSKILKFEEHFPNSPHNSGAGFRNRVS